jgi:hypothetical protein
MATAVSNTETIANVNGSLAVTPNSRLETARRSHKAPTSPSARPAQPQALTDNHPEDVAGLCADGHAQADFPGACRDGVLDES